MAMKKTGAALSLIGLAVWLAVAPLPARAQDIAQMLQEKTAALRAAVEINQQSLRKYTWIETTEIAVKGEVKDTKVYNCRYGPDGKVQKTELSNTSDAKSPRGPLRKAIASSEAQKMKDYMQRAVNLVQEYVPPSPAKLKGVVDAGHTSISQAGPEAIQLQFNDYQKAGDSVQFLVNKEAKKLRKLTVNTSLDADGSQDPVTLTVDFETLPDGTDAPAKKVLSAPAKSITVTVSDNNYQRLAN